MQLLHIFPSVFTVLFLAVVRKDFYLFPPLKTPRPQRPGDESGVPCCHLSIDRDLNAALNIRALGLQSLGIHSVEAPV